MRQRKAKLFTNIFYGLYFMTPSQRATIKGYYDLGAIGRSAYHAGPISASIWIQKVSSTSFWRPRSGEYRSVLWRRWLL